MAKFLIEGGVPLKGKVKAQGNKNSVLKLMAACLLTDKECQLSNVPKIRDVLILGEILKRIGVEVKGLGTETLRIRAEEIKTTHLPDDLVTKLRASLVLLGPLLGRFGQARMSHPGGCVIGKRPVGTHFDALAAFGAKIIAGKKDYIAEVKKPHPADIFLDEVSVTATQNAMIMTSLIEGETRIRDAACEPDVVELAEFLKKMGVNVSGAGTPNLKIEGRKSLGGVVHRVWPDHIDVGTFAIAAAVTQGKVEITDVRKENLEMILLYLSRFGVKFSLTENSLKVFPSKLKAPERKIQTRPWPGFPTDLMSPLLVLATQAKGSTLCHDWMYENRMFFVDKLMTMGADIIVCDPHRVLVKGPTPLLGKELESPDIRAGMALILAALCAKGKSTIGKVELVERGYEEIEERLKSLGAKIRRVD